MILEIVIRRPKRGSSVDFQERLFHWVFLLDIPNLHLHYPPLRGKERRAENRMLAKIRTRAFRLIGGFGKARIFSGDTESEYGREMPR